MTERDSIEKIVAEMEGPSVNWKEPFHDQVYAWADRLKALQQQAEPVGEIIRSGAPGALDAQWNPDFIPCEGMRLYASAPSASEGEQLKLRTSLCSSQERSDCPPAQQAHSPTDSRAFKNFHRSLCERFGYAHDEVYWWRDQVSLEEHIASLVTKDAPAQQEPFPEYVIALLIAGGYVSQQKVDEARAIALGVATGQLPPAQQDEEADELAALKQSRDFYRRRWVALDAIQSRMRDPERKAVCDILANGSTQALDGRDEQPSRQEEEAVTRSREADRARFRDPDFNKWLDDVISDAGHTVYDTIPDVACAWAGWEAKALEQSAQGVPANNFRGETSDEVREVLVNSLRAGKSWTTGYAEAYIEEAVALLAASGARNACEQSPAPAAVDVSLRSSSVPEGWKLVPCELPDEMLGAAGYVDGFDLDAGYDGDKEHRKWWRNAIAAAPAPEVSRG